MLIVAEAMLVLGDQAKAERGQALPNRLIGYIKLERKLDPLAQD